jgi:hypothetical protein
MSNSNKVVKNKSRRREEEVCTESRKQKKESSHLPAKCKKDEMRQCAKVDTIEGYTSSAM